MGAMSQVFYKELFTINHLVNSHLRLFREILDAQPK